MGDGALIDKCLAEGQKTERATDIYVVQLQHSGGIIMVYKNETDGSKLTEELGLDITGLCIEDQDDQTKVDIEIGPGEQKVIKLSTTGGGWGFASSCSYGISSA